MTEDTEAERLASVAPAEDREDDDSDDETPAEIAVDLHTVAEAWARWCRTRNFYIRPSLPVSVLGQLRSKGTGRSVAGGPNAICSAELMAFHLATLAQPADALDRRVFELHYYWQVRNIKVAAAELGISRQHWYRLVRDFGQRALIASRDIHDANLQAVEALPSRCAVLTGECR